MTRKEAVEELNFYRNQHYADPSGTPERKLADAINEVLPHYDALCKQEKPSEDCEWCDHFRNDPQCLVSKGDGMYDEIVFEFCPKCSRRLVKSGRFKEEPNHEEVRV